MQEIALDPLTKSDLHSSRESQIRDGQTSDQDKITMKITGLQH